MRTINKIILHCAATPEGKDYTVEQIRQWHLQRGFQDIGYHYVIYRDGSIHKGRAIEKAGAHCTGHNSDSIGICYIGGMDKDNKKAKDTRTQEQRFALFKICAYLCNKYRIPESFVMGHYEYANKACPSFDMKTFRNELVQFRKSYKGDLSSIYITND